MPKPHDLQGFLVLRPYAFYSGSVPLAAPGRKMRVSGVAPNPVSRENRPDGPTPGTHGFVRYRAFPGFFGSPGGFAKSVNALLQS
jgi:hypothetical protein